MTTLDHRLPSAISDDASLVAVIVPSTSTSSTTSRRHLIQLYRVASSSSSCSLQSTLAHSTDHMQLNELIFCGSSLLVALFGTVEVVVWDLDRGVVAHKFRTQDDDSKFLALSSAAFATSGGQNEPPSFYILTRYGAKLYSQEYQNGKVIRKIKSGKCEEDQQQDDDGNKIWGLAVTKEHIIVKSSNGIRIMQLDTAKKVGKIMNKGASGKMDVCCNQQIGGGSDDDTLAVLESAGSVVLYSLPTGKKLARIPHEMTATSAQHATLQLLASKDSKSSNMTYKLLIESTVYNITGSSFEEVTKLTTSKSNLVAVFLLKKKLLALMNQIGGCRSIWFHLEEEDIPAAISLDDAETAEDDDENKSSSKRKAGNNQPIMLGPGQAGMEASQPVLKKAKVETKKGRNVEDDNEEGPSDTEKDMSIAERLQRLAEAMDDDDDDLLGDDDDDVVASNVSFKPKSATTESLKEFLTQALQSGDESLLELALQVQDKKLIARTVKDIDTSLVGILCNKLTTKLASNPLRSEQLCKWVSLCLQTGNFKSHHTMPLRNLLDERVETYPDMLRLQGRLSALIDTE